MNTHESQPDNETVSDENTHKRQENASPEIVSNEEALRFGRAAARAFAGETSPPIEASNDRESRQQLEKIMLQKVHGLPEALAKRLGTVNPEPFNRRANELRTELQEAIDRSADADTIASLQVELIFQHLAVISRVQNGGDSGFLPTVAKEVNGIDCSLSAWCLQEKLKDVPMLTCNGGYATGHAIDILTLANGKKVYVDAQNGFVTEVALEETRDEEQKTAYPIYKMTPLARLSGHLEGREVTMAREDGCDYVPPYVGIHESNLLHSVGNMHMLWRVSEEAVGDPAFWNAYRTKAAQTFREDMKLPPLNPVLYQKIDSAFDRWKKESGYHKEFVKYVLQELDTEPAMTETDARQALQSQLQTCEDAMKTFQAWVEAGEGGLTIGDPALKICRLCQAHHQAWQDKQEETASSDADMKQITQIKEGLANDQ